METSKKKNQTLAQEFSVILALVFIFLINSCGNSSFSDEEIDDPTAIPAFFAISSLHDQSTGETKVNAGAIFKGEGLTTLEFLNGEVEVEDPHGNIYPLEVHYNNLGAPSYNAELPAKMELGAFYSFRVTLPSGRLIVNSIKTPDEELRIIEPVSSGFVHKSEPLEVSWTGRGYRKVSIVVGPEHPNALSFLQSGGALTADDGRTLLDPDSMALVRPGPNLLTIIRGRDVLANGFHGKSKVGAVLLTSTSVTVERNWRKERT